MAQLRAAGTRRPGGAGPHILGGPWGWGRLLNPGPQLQVAREQGSESGVPSPPSLRVPITPTSRAEPRGGNSPREVRRGTMVA